MESDAEHEDNEVEEGENDDAQQREIAAYTHAHGETYTTSHASMPHIFCMHSLCRLKSLISGCVCLNMEGSPLKPNA